MKILIFLLLIPLCIFSQIEGKVIAVKDGDTIVILDEDNTAITIRIADIDCPEYKQPFSKKAKQFVSDEIFKKQVTVYSNKKDRFGRLIGTVVYENKNLSIELLKQGLAWHYTRFSNNMEYDMLEKTARLQKIGIWSELNPTPPWDHRKIYKSKKWNH